MNPSAQIKSFTPPLETGRSFEAQSAQSSRTTDEFPAVNPALMESLMQPAVPQEEGSVPVETLNASQQLNLWREAPKDTAERVGLHGLQGVVFDSSQRNTANRINELKANLPQKETMQPDRLPALAEAMKTAQGAPSFEGENTAPEEQSSERRAALADQQKIAENTQKLLLRAQSLGRQNRAIESTAGHNTAMSAHTNQRVEVPNIGNFVLLKKIFLGAEELNQRARSILSTKSQKRAQRKGPGAFEGMGERKSDMVAEMSAARAQKEASHEFALNE